MPSLHVAGHELEIETIAGAGPTLVFLHEGLGCVSRWRDFPAKIAAATGRAALVYSRAGYGRSEPARLTRPVSFMHDEALRVLPALLDAAAPGDVVLIGHSDGASIALIHAGRAGRRVRGLVALAPHVFVEDIGVRSIAALRADYLDPETEVRQKLAKHHADVDNAFLGWADIWLDPAFRAWDITDVLPRIAAPVMVIQGTLDEYGTLAQVDALCSGLPSGAERVILPECGHVPQRDAPEATAAAIERFVRSRGA